jgi:TetR/AcrR family transcriptional regulator, transcriptional repressor for nem operon
VDEVVDRAMHVFWKHGYEGTGLVALERATGLGRQSLYGVFGDKRGLFTRAVERYFDCVIRPGIDTLDAPGSARANLERFLSATEFNGCLLGNSVPELAAKDSEISALLARKLELMEAAFARALRRAKRDAELSADLDVKSTARALLTLAQGLAVIARANRDPYFVRGVVQAARSLLR